jgi:hypothetical protein
VVHKHGEEVAVSCFGTAKLCDGVEEGFVIVLSGHFQGKSSKVHLIPLCRDLRGLPALKCHYLQVVYLLYCDLCMLIKSLVVFARTTAFACWPSSAVRVTGAGTSVTTSKHRYKA